MGSEILPVEKCEAYQRTTTLTAAVDSLPWYPISNFLCNRISRRCIPHPIILIMHRKKLSSNNFKLTRYILSSLSDVLLSKISGISNLTQNNLTAVLGALASFQRVILVVLNNEMIDK